MFSFIYGKTKLSEKMVLDLDILRKDKGGDPDLVRQSEINRYKGTALVDKVLEKDDQWRKERFRLDNWHKKKNMCGRAFRERMKNKAEIKGQEPLSVDDILSLSFEQMSLCSRDDIRAISVKVDDEIAKSKQRVSELEAERDVSELEAERDAAFNEIGNLLHPQVPISNDEQNNRIERTFKPEPRRNQPTELLSHIDLCVLIDGVDYERGQKVMGSRGYFLKGPLVFLEQALVQYASRILLDDGYQCLSTPIMIKRSIMQEVAQLSQFDEELYKVTAGSTDENDDHTKYLIATSEQPIAAFHRDEWLSPQTLPVKYCGISPCFRLEAGSHGKDTRGIFRVHQFQKVEQFVITSPSDSWPMFHRMIEHSEKFAQALGLPYRIVNIVSGELNNAAAMKYDLEAEFPGSGTFRELVSCSNCTDYQSRRLKVRFGQTKKSTVSGGPIPAVEYVHMLNATMCATTRTMCAILENHQTEEGIVIVEISAVF
ncbi:hypothetical protein ACOME3_005467 [Neoechinorhynchus agilis]